MMLIRPIAESDYPALLEIAEESGIGFTSLPYNEEILSGKLQRSLESFARTEESPEHELYLFVLEDTATGTIAGTTAIATGVGTQEAFYHYHRETVVHASRELNVHNRMEVLTLCNHYTGATEVCTLYLREPYRKGTNGRLLSKCRFLFMAQHPQRFNPKVIAEMRGVSDSSGHSPFWEWLGDNFFSMDFPRADYLVGLGNKVFIAELMPKYPLYVNLLSKEARAVISQVHEKTRPALRLLEKEGFQHAGYIDIFDGGPTVEAPLQQIHSVEHSQQRLVEVGAFDQGGRACLVCNDRLQGFRATLTELLLPEQGAVRLTPEVAAVLAVEPGDQVRVIELEGVYPQHRRL
ncbi:MAG TPA: arginine N-succinyltransferase [Motiliproteus sp.]